MSSSNSGACFGGDASLLFFCSLRGFLRYFPLCVVCVNLRARTRLFLFPVFFALGFVVHAHPARAFMVATRV